MHCPIANARWIWYDNTSWSKYENHRFTSRKAGKGHEEPKNQKGKRADSSAVLEKLCGGGNRCGTVRTDNLTGESIGCRRPEQSHHGRNVRDGSAGGWLKSEVLPERVGHAGGGGL